MYPSGARVYVRIRWTLVIRADGPLLENQKNVAAYAHERAVPVRSAPREKGSLKVMLLYSMLICSESADPCGERASPGVAIT